MRPVLIFIVLLVATKSSVFAQNTVLQQGDTLEKRLQKGQSHLYSFQLKKGEYAICLVNQKTVLVAVDVLDVSGKVLKTYNELDGIAKSKQVSLKAPKRVLINCVSIHCRIQHCLIL